jgi:hypothetical protein
LVVVVVLLKNWGAVHCGIPLALFPFISHPFICSSFLLMYLCGERLLLGPLSKAFRHVLYFFFEFRRCPPEWAT